MEGFTPRPEDLGLNVTLRDFAAGQVLFDRYRLKRVLGRGGMGVVWQAADLRLDREVALKFLPDTITFNLEALDNLKRETRRSLLLTHPHIVRIYDLVRDETWACISMEYVAGSALSSLKVDQSTGCFETAELCAWVRQLTEGLEYAHKRARVIHRDLKPGNLMLTETNELKIADFGISRTLTDSHGQLSSPADSSGTLSYMSPQQARGLPAAVADDVYSLGATLYDLLSGKPPFFSGNIAYQVQEIVPPSIAQRRAELGTGRASVSQAWEDTIACCLLKDSARRPDSAAEVARRLFHEPITMAHAPAISIESPLPHPGPIVSSRGHGARLMTGALLGLTLLLAAGGWWMLSPARPHIIVTTSVPQQTRLALVSSTKQLAPAVAVPMSFPSSGISRAPVSSSPSPIVPPVASLQAFRAGDYISRSGDHKSVSVTGPFPAEDNRQTWVCTGAVNGTWTTGPVAGHPQLTTLPPDAILPKGWTFGLTTEGTIMAVSQLDDELVIMQPRKTVDEWNRLHYVEEGAQKIIFQIKPATNP